MRSLGLFLFALIGFVAVGITPNRAAARMLPDSVNICLPDDDHPIPFTPCLPPPRVAQP